MVFVPTDDRAWHQRFSFRSRREKKGKLLRTGRDKVLSNHTNHMISHKTEERLELVGSGRVRLETSQLEPTSSLEPTRVSRVDDPCDSIDLDGSLHKFAHSRSKACFFL